MIDRQVQTHPINGFIIGIVSVYSYLSTRVDVLLRRQVAASIREDTRKTFFVIISTKW